MASVTTFCINTECCVTKKIIRKPKSYHSLSCLFSPQLQIRQLRHCPVSFCDCCGYWNAGSSGAKDPFLELCVSDGMQGVVVQTRSGQGWMVGRKILKLTSTHFSKILQEIKTIFNMLNFQSFSACNFATF